MERRAFEIVGSRPLGGDEPIPLAMGLHAKVQEALEEEGWGIFWSTNFDRAGVGRCLFPFRAAPPSLMQEVEKLSPLYLLGMPWGAAIYLEEKARCIQFIISSPEAIQEVFFSDLEGTARNELEAHLAAAADVLRRVGRDVVGTVVDGRYRGARFSGRKQNSKEKYSEILFDRPLGPGESAKEAMEDVADKMGKGLDHTFYWHVSGVAPVSDTARITMTCHVPYARLAMEMETYHCPALPCTAVAFVEGGRVKAAMLKPIHMFRTFFRDVPFTTGIKYVRFPFAVRKEIATCLCRYLDCA